MPTIRNLEKKDASQVALLIHQLTKNIVEPEVLDLRIEHLVGAVNCQYVVVEHNGKVVGFGGLAWYQIPSKGLVGWLEEIVVDEASRGQGIGTLLVKHLLLLSEQKEIAIVKLTSTGPIANQLYQNLGFEKKDQEYFIRKRS